VHKVKSAGQQECFAIALAYFVPLFVAVSNGINTFFYWQ